jgi:hypothetical protein
MIEVLESQQGGGQSPTSTLGEKMAKAYSGSSQHASMSYRLLLRPESPCRGGPLAIETASK